MTARKIFWDSCVFVTLLSKHKEQEWKDKQQICKGCLQEAIDGKVEIFISTMTIVEVNKTKESANPVPQEIKQKIAQLIDQPFIKVVSADLARAKNARSYIWDHSWLKPVDAMHLACALHAEVDELFTYDGKGSQKGLLDLDELIGTPPLKIKFPHFEGTQTKLPEQ